MASTRFHPSVQVIPNLDVLQDDPVELAYLWEVQVIPVVVSISACWLILSADDCGSIPCQRHIFLHCAMLSFNSMKKLQ